MKHSDLLGLLPLALAACSATPSPQPHVSGAPPISGLRPVDELIQPDEQHFAHLWQVTQGGENAEGYWSFAGDRLTLQRRFGESRCDRVFLTEPGADFGEHGPLRQLTDGRGVCTCSYFLPGDRAVLFASTQGGASECPPPPDFSQGYTWMLHPEYDIWVHDLASGAQEPLTTTWGYDAEATVSPRGDRMVFTSLRSGDLELWTSDLAGGDLRQITHTPGYDGGAFFSHSGERLVWRRTEFAPDGELGDRAQYRELLAQNKIRPHKLELWLADADGSNARALTALGGASFAPFFFPDDQRVIFSSDHPDPPARNFDLYAIGVDGSGLERITSYVGFDSFPMFSPDGRFLVFASNRGGQERGETNLFIAQWR